MPVRFAEGTTRGFLALRDLDGKIIAFGELRQTIHGKQLNSRLTFRFKDGSLDDEITIYTQESVFHLISDHHIQRGPSFPHPIDTTIDTASGTVTTHSSEHGQDAMETHPMDLPPDIANGLVVNILRNLRPDSPKTEVSYVSESSKPRLTKLAILPDGEERYTVAGTVLKARRYLIKVELNPIVKIAAAAIDKLPVDGHAWISEDSPSVMLRADYQLYEEGPIWRIELAAPAWKIADKSPKKAAPEK